MIDLGGLVGKTGFIFIVDLQQQRHPLLFIYLFSFLHLEIFHVISCAIFVCLFAEISLETF